MKWSIAAAAILAALGLLAYTNPDLDRYDQFINRALMEQARQQNNPLVNTLGSLFSGIASNIVVRQTVRNNYMFFSTYETAVGKESFKAIGLLNDFVITEKPEFMRDGK